MLSGDERKATCRQEALGECENLHARVPSVPATVWSGQWKRIVSKKIRHRIEHQVHRWSEAGVMTVRHICRNVEASGKRHLVLSDAMSVVLAGSKGRSNSAILARKMQKIAALCFSGAPADSVAMGS